MKKVIIFFLFLLCYTLSAEDKFALIIGNGEYNESPLKNTINDADDIATSFENLGYKVIKVINGTQQKIEASVYNVRDSLTDGSMVVFYYTGHAVQVDNSNYIIPVKADIRQEADIKYKCIDLRWILEIFRDSQCKTYITILDACRDNPYKNSTRGGTRGLKVIHNPVSDRELRNSAIIYATTEGNVALDGTGRNSPFTKAFLKYVKEEDETVLDIMTKVTNDVFRSTNSSQNPIITNDFKEKVYFSKRENTDKNIGLKESLNAEYYVKAGIDSYKQEKFDEALKSLNLAMDINPNYSYIYYPLALTFEKLKDNTNRKDMLEISVSMRPEHAASLYELGRYYTDMEDYDKALALFLKAEELKKDSVKYQMGVALSYFNLGNFEKSIELYESIIKIDQTISEVYYNLSNARIRVGDYDQALTDVSIAIKLKPDSPIYLFTIGEISEALGSDDKAVTYYLNALKLDTTYFKPMLNLGNIYQRQGKSEDALRMLKAAFALDSQNPGVRASLGVSYLNNKMYKESLELLKEAHENDPESPPKLYNLSLVYTEVGENQKAEEGFLKVIEMDPEYWEAYFYLGQMLYSLGRHDEAKAFFEKLLKLKPDYDKKDLLYNLLDEKTVSDDDNIKQTYLYLPIEGLGGSLVGTGFGMTFIDKKLDLRFYVGISPSFGQTSIGGDLTHHFISEKIPINFYYGVIYRQIHGIIYLNLWGITSGLEYHYQFFSCYLDLLLQGPVLETPTLLRIRLGVKLWF